MKTFISPNVGRTFIVRLERGDYLKEAIAELAQNEGIANGVIVSGIATFDEAQLEMTTTYDFPIDYHVEHLQEPLELASVSGTIIHSEPHIHGVISNAQKTWAGHLMDGCRILYLGEIVIQELLGNNLIRKSDEAGARLIYEIQNDGN